MNVQCLPNMRMVLRDTDRNSFRGPGSPYTGGPLGSYIFYYKGTRFPIYKWNPGFIYIVLQGD